MRTNSNQHHATPSAPKFFKTCILLISKTTVGLETSLFLRGEVISKLPELTYF
jgi:hypothetical protein